MSFHFVGKCHTSFSYKGGNALVARFGHGKQDHWCRDALQTVFAESSKMFEMPYTFVKWPDLVVFDDAQE